MFLLMSITWEVHIYPNRLEMHHWELTTHSVTEQQIVCNHANFAWRCKQWQTCVQLCWVVNANQQYALFCMLNWKEVFSWWALVFSLVKASNMASTCQRLNCWHPPAQRLFFNDWSRRWWDVQVFPWIGMKISISVSLSMLFLQVQIALWLCLQQSPSGSCPASSPSARPSPGLLIRSSCRTRSCGWWADTLSTTAPSRWSSSELQQQTLLSWCPLSSCTIPMRRPHLICNHENIQIGLLLKCGSAVKSKPDQENASKFLLKTWINTLTMLFYCNAPLLIWWFININIGQMYSETNYGPW